MVEKKSFQPEASDRQVIRYLLTHKKADRYEMWKKAKDAKSYSSVFNAVKKLQKWKVIKVADSKPSEKNPKIEVDQYALTLTGLVLACNWVLDWSEIDKVADMHQDDFPLVFGKWKHFLKHGKRQDVIERFHDAIISRTISLSRMRDYRTVESEATKEWCRRMRIAGEPSFMDIEYKVTLETLMRDYTLSQVIQADPENVKEARKRLWKLTDEWRDVCLKDPEIKAFCEPVAERLLEQHKKGIEYLQKWVS